MIEWSKLRAGVGICTRNRPECLQGVLRKLVQYGLEGPIRYDIFVADDGSEDEGQLEFLSSLPPEAWNSDDRERVGVAKNKNRILRRFRDYDFQIIFEDDAFPIHKDWLAVHIEVSQLSQIHHFNFIPHSVPAHVGDTYKTTAWPLENGEVIHVAQTQNITGVFLFYTRRVLEVLGGFDKRFGLWGFEHVEFSDRIRDSRIGLSPPFLGYPSLLECERYIKWDDSIPSTLNEEEKTRIRDEQRVIWDKIREDYFLFRPL